MESPWLSDFRAKYGESTVKRYRAMVEKPTCPPELAERENRLRRRYTELMSSLRYDYNGEKLPLRDLTDRFSGDDDRRFAAWYAAGKGYDSVKDELDEIFDGLVKVRTEIANRAGYDSYTDYVYAGKVYKKAEIAEFRTAVMKYFVPISEIFVRQQADRLGKTYPLNFADYNMPFREGLPAPIGTPEDTLNTAVRMFHDICPETSAFVDFMLETELIYTRFEATGGFDATLPLFKGQIQISRFAGDVTDVNSVVHEGGHSFAYYMKGDKRPHLHWDFTSEIGETHAQVMEMICFSYMEWFFGDKADTYRYSHIMDSFTFLPYCCAIDSFEEEIYDHPEYTPADRVELWRSLMARYMPWLKMADIPFYGDARHWQRQSHICGSPFYFLTYGLSEIVALQFFALLQKDREDGLKKYLKLVDFGGSLDFVELVQAVSMESPLSDEGVKNAAEEITKWLQNFDVSKIK